jgi:ParB/RepB/Spo0J family partition protein
MPSPLRRLGKHGLGVYNVHVDAIKVRQGWNARTVLDTADLEQWIEVHGTRNLTPLRVSLIDGALWLNAGHRRLQACKNLLERGVPIASVPVQLETEKNEAKLFALSISENAGLPLTAHEEATAFHRLILYGWEMSDIVKEVGKSSTHVHNRLALLDAAPVVQEAIQEHAISTTDAVNIVKQSKRTGKAQEDVLAHVTATKVDRRRRDAKKIPRETQCARALQPIIERYGLALCREIVRCWPVLDAEPEVP